MKKLLLVLLLIPLISIAQTKKKVKKIKIKTPTVTNVINTIDISAGLKEALNKGVTEQVSKLTVIDGFYKNEAVKILIPEELQRVDATLRKLGMGSLVDDGIKSLNRAAEDAVKESTPIFVNAIKNISISDAKGILLGNESAATSYLKDSTTKELYQIQSCSQSLLERWAQMLLGIQYKVQHNPISEGKLDISDYVTTKAMEGVFKMIVVEEKHKRKLSLEI